jgi:hypothetical protein
VAGALVAAALGAGIVAALTAIRPGGSAPPGSASSSSGGYAAEYHGTRFTMHGAGCQGGADSTPSAVDFTAQGPQVTPNPSDIFDGNIVLNCYWGGTVGDDSTEIWFGTNTRVAEVRGSPGAQACDTAITRQPISASDIRFSQLHSGTQFCLIPGFSADQLVLVTLVSKSNSAYDLNWAATAWTILAMTN